jgi:hypothetical protein
MLMMCSSGVGISVVPLSIVRRTNVLICCEFASDITTAAASQAVWQYLLTDETLHSTLFH